MIPTSLSSENLQAKGWKQKIEGVKSLTAQIKNHQLYCCPAAIEPLLISLIRDTNLNVVQATVQTLKYWIPTYGTRNTKVQKQLLEDLIILAEMGRPSINENLVSIATSLFKREKEGKNGVSRVALQPLDHETFNSSNNPTFFVGSVESETIQEVQQSQEIEQPENPLSDSPILTLLSKKMQSCKKPSFVLCLRILLSLEKEGLLTEDQFANLKSQVKEINSVIEHRRVSQEEFQKKDQKLSQELSDLMCQLKQLR